MSGTTWPAPPKPRCLTGLSLRQIVKIAMAERSDHTCNSISPPHLLLFVIATQFDFDKHKLGVRDCGVYSLS